MPHRILDLKNGRSDLPSHRLPGTSLRTSHVPEVSSRLQQSWVPCSTASARSYLSFDNARQMCLGDIPVRPGRPLHGSIRLSDGSVFPESPPGFAEAHRGTRSLYNPTIENILSLSDSSSESAEDNSSPSVTPNRLHLRGHDSPTSPPVGRSQPSTPPARNALVSIFNPEATEFSPCPSAVSSPRGSHAQPVHGCDTFVQAERANKLRSVNKIEDDRDREEAMNDFIFDQATPWIPEDEVWEKERRKLNRHHERLGRHRKTSD
ncbi:hypothetical protein FGRMN_8130 [Fusarium graminum]|nr:hypothetical protein FGRMN_8130 [Fusarium graminum]